MQTFVEDKGFVKGLENVKKGSGSTKLKGELTVHFNCENTEKKSWYIQAVSSGRRKSKELGHVLWILNG